MPRNALTRKQREFLRHKEEIMQTALLLFSEKGFSNVSMQEIAVKSEFAVGTLYKFFSTKEELYLEVLKEKINELHLNLSNALDISGNEIKKLRAFIEKKLEWFKENTDYVRLYVTETFGIGFIDKDALDQIKIFYHKELIGKIEALFTAAIEKKIFKEMDPYFLAVSLNGLSNGVLFELLENKEFEQVEAESVLNIFLKSVYQAGSDDAK